MKGIKGFQKGNKFGHQLKGRTKETHKYIKIMAKKHEGKNNPIWKGGISQHYLNVMKIKYKIKLKQCSLCNKRDKSRKGGLIVHHKDGNRTNNKKSNLVVICQSCHVRIHKPRKGTGKKN